MDVDRALVSLDTRLRAAVAHYWKTRQKQLRNQRVRGGRDQGLRAAVTGGAQMDGFLELVADLLQEVGVPASCIHYHRNLELPGYFRPTKEWDLVVVKDQKFIAGLEAKSQVGSFGNNFNNRTEEAMGSALDLWTAYREGAFLDSACPWLGYLFLLQDCDAARRAVRTREPHFPVFQEFKDSSYARRYELFCRKLVRERHYTAAAFLLSPEETGPAGKYTEPASDLSVRQLLRSLLCHARAHV
jgi:hypothetical protein